MRNFICFYCVFFLVYACDPFSDIEKKEINLDGDNKVYILSKTWGIGGGGHYKLVLSKNTKIDQEDMELGGNFEVIYSVENNKLILHVSESRTINIPNDFNDIVTIKRHKGIDYVHLLKKADTMSNLHLYYPFDKK